MQSPRRAPKTADTALKHRDGTFLTRAIDLLSSSLDYEASLSAVARLAVSHMGDWCVVHVLEGGVLRQIAIANDDPKRTAWATELSKRYPPDPEAPRGVYSVIRTGEAEVYTDIADDLLAASARDAEHLKILRAVDMRHVMIVPLVSRNKTLGTISFVACGDGRRYDQAALAEARQLGRLAGTSLDNALLYRAAQEAQRKAETELAERRKAEAGLRESEARYRSIIETAQEGIWVVDADYRTTFVNSRMAEMLGYAPEEMVGRHVQDFLDASELRAFEQRKEHREGGRRGDYDSRYTRKDGSELWVIVSSTPLLDSDGRFAGAAAMITDITHRKRLDLDQARLAAIVESSEDAIVSKDLNGIVTSWNAAAERIYGWKAEDIIGKSKGLVIPPELPNELSSILDKIRAGERIQHYETKRLHKQGHIFDVAISVSPVKDSSGTIVGAATIVRDITAQVRARQEIEALNDRLRRAMQETHHRVKNNLQVVAAMVDLQVMERGPQASVPVEELSRLGDHVRTLAAVHDVLTHYLQEEEQEQLLSIRTVFDRLIPLLEKAAGDRPVRAEVDDTSLTGKQATALALVTNELVSNAVKHGIGPVALRFASEEPEATLSVRDHGPGFPEGFDPELAANTGLLLVGTLVATDLRGTVRYENHPEGGAEVRVTIPLPKPPCRPETTDGVDKEV